MNHNLNRREMLQTLTLGAGGVLIGNKIVSATPKIFMSTPLARCMVMDQHGEPLDVKDFDRFYICDLIMRPFTIDPVIRPGEVTFQLPVKPFRISLPMTIPGFGQVFVYADNRGKGYTAQSFSEQPLMLNYEFAADRLTTVQNLLQECQRSGLNVSQDARRRVDKAQDLLNTAGGLVQNRSAYIDALMSSLCESLWAGEMIVIGRAEQMIERNGPRHGFLFGCNGFDYTQYGKPYAEQFEVLFNYATLPFYRGFVERVKGQKDYSEAEKILGWINGSGIIPKGHPLIFLVPSATPAWLQNLSYQETKKICLQNVEEAILKFRNHIHIWDVINEAHVQPDNYPAPGRPYMKGFTKEEMVDLTIEALKEAHKADPTCFRVVNSTGTWCDYYMGRNPQPWHQSVYDYLQMIKDAGAEYEAAGLQYYHSGRDMLEFERNLECFKDIGKRIHITELGFPSTSDAPKDHEWWGGGVGGGRYVWHGERFTEEMQADWIEAVYKIAFSKSYVDAITHWDFIDPGFLPNDGFVREDLSRKPCFDRLLSMQTKWREQGILPAITKT